MVPGDAPVLIDLGEDWSTPTPAGPVRRRPRSWRIPAVAVLSVAMLLVLGGSERDGPRLRPVATVQATEAMTVALSADTAYVADQAIALRPDRDLYGAVTAYRLPGGQALWRTPLPQVAQRVQYLPDAGVVVASAIYGPDNLIMLVTLDAATGRQLWTSDDGLLADAPGDGLGLVSPYLGGTVQWVNLRTGRKIWSQPVSSDAQMRVAHTASPEDPGLVVLLAADGTVDVLAEHTGEVVASGGVGLLDATDGQLGLPGDHAKPTLDVLGTVLLVFHSRLGGPVSLTAYDLSRMSPLWTKTGAYRGYATACGVLICLPGDAGVSGVDPATGREVWHTVDWTDTGALYADGVMVFADRTGDEVALLDAGTGRVRAPLTGWTGVAAEPGGYPSVFMRSSPSGDKRAWFAALDPGHATPTVLGALPDTAFRNCWADAGLIACRTSQDRLRIWRYRS